MSKTVVNQQAVNKPAVKQPAKRAPKPPSGPAAAGGDRAVEDAWGALLRVHAALVPVLDRELQASHRLPLAWYDLLLELYWAPDRRLRMSELGDRATLSRTRVSRLVDEMAMTGLVVRQQNPEDRRSAFAAMTPAGRTLFRQAAPTYQRGIREHFGAALSEDDVTAIRDGLGRVVSRAAGRTPA